MGRYAKGTLSKTDHTQKDRYTNGTLSRTEHTKMGRHSEGTLSRTELTKMGLYTKRCSCLLSLDRQAGGTGEVGGGSTGVGNRVWRESDHYDPSSGRRGG